MEIDWSEAKRKSLWGYDQLIEKIREVLAFPFVQDCCNHTMPQAEQYAQSMLSFLRNQNEIEYIAEIISIFRSLGGQNISNYQDLIDRVNTKEKCEQFLSNAKISFSDLIQILTFLFRWVLPFKIYLRELIATQDTIEEENLVSLKNCGVKFNVDLLEHGRTPAGRKRLSAETNISEKNLLELVHRADMSRLPYVRGKTVKHLCGGGYTSLRKIATADLVIMEKEMDAYFGRMGKRYSDFAASMPLYWLIGAAKILPAVVDY